MTFFSTVIYPNGRNIVLRDSAQAPSARVGLAAFPAQSAQGSTINEDGLIAVSRAYHDHHFECRQCVAAGRGRVYASRCEKGQALFTAYTNWPAHGEATSDDEGAARGGSSATDAPKALPAHPDGNHGDNRRLQK